MAGVGPAKRQAIAIEISIRPVEARDLPQVGAIVASTGLFPKEMLPEMIAGYLDGAKRDIWFLCRADGEAVAFCEPERMTEGTWNLLAIAVLPERQGMGIGSALIRYLEERLAKRGDRILLVETMGTPEFEATRAFYRKNGFTEEARIREFYEAGADKVVFWKHL